MDVIGGLLSGGASLLGGMLSNSNQQQLAQQNNMYNMMAQLQAQQYQTYMSNTAYQRGVADMKAAGLNPAMMFGGSGGPASTPSSPVLSGTMAQVHDVIGPAVERAIAALRLDNETELNKAVVAKTTADAATSAAQAEKLQAETQNTRALHPYVASEAAARVKSTTSSAAQAQQTAANLLATLPRIRAEGKISELESEEHGAVGPDKSAQSLYRTAATAAQKATQAATQVYEQNSARSTAEARLRARLHRGSEDHNFGKLIPTSQW